jgi:hypothetical protein
MPIRKRLTGSDNDSKPELPPAILSEETAEAIGVIWDELNLLKPRAKFKAALAALPLGKSMPVKEWNQHWVLPYLRQKFRVRGIDLAIYPVDKRAMFDDSYTTCIAAQVTVLTRHPKTGMPHVLRLTADFQEAWYTMVITWLVDTGFISW